jgi:Bcr/CflA subfamily drug resistance transporter
VTQKTHIFIIVLMVACLFQVSTDIYTPALPAISHLFGVHINWVQLSLSIYLFGVAASLLIYGILSEGLGRKQPLLIGLLVMLVGTVICIVSRNVAWLIAGRFLQGLGAGAPAGLWRAIFRDCFVGDEMSQYSSYLTIGIIFIVPAAPVVGASILTLLGWREIFVFILLYGVATLLTVKFWLAETSAHHDESRLSMSFIIDNHKRLLSHPKFMTITVCNFLNYGAFFSWFVVSPVLLIQHLGLSPFAYGVIGFVIPAIAFSLGGWLNSRIVKRVGKERMLMFAWVVIALSGILMLMGYAILGVELWVILLPLALFFFGGTLLWPNAFAISMEPFGDIAGYAGSLYSFMQLSGGAVIGSLMAHLPDSNQLALGVSFVLAPTISYILYQRVS